jgi:hypothetical protein
VLSRPGTGVTTRKSLNRLYSRHLQHFPPVTHPASQIPRHTLGHSTCGKGRSENRHQKRPYIRQWCFLSFCRLHQNQARIYVNKGLISENRHQASVWRRFFGDDRRRFGDDSGDDSFYARRASRAPRDWVRQSSGVLIALALSANPSEHLGVDAISPSHLERTKAPRQTFRMNHAAALAHTARIRLRGVLLSPLDDGILLRLHQRPAIPRIQSLSDGNYVVTELGRGLHKFRANNYCGALMTFRRVRHR